MNISFCGLASMVFQPDALEAVDIPDIDLPNNFLDAFPSFKDPAPEAKPLQEPEKQLVAKICKEKRGMKRRRGHGRANSDPEALRRAATVLASEFDLDSVAVPAPTPTPAGESAAWCDLANLFTGVCSSSGRCGLCI